MAIQKLDEAVSNIERKILEALHQRQIINMNKEVGVAYLQQEDRDKINPCVTVTGKELKELTGREKLRLVVVDKLQEELKKRDWVTVERTGNDLRICLMAVREKENEFASLASLIGKNRREIAENEELAELP